MLFCSNWLLVISCWLLVRGFLLTINQLQFVLPKHCVFRKISYDRTAYTQNCVRPELNRRFSFHDRRFVGARFPRPFFKVCLIIFLLGLTHAALL